jgi:hypothetical protein
VLSLVFLALTAAAVCAAPAPATVPSAHPPSTERKKVAALVADWFHNSHPDVLFTRIFETYTRDGHGLASQLDLVTVYRDLPSSKDQSEKYAAQSGFRIVPSVEAALTLGTGKLAVDGVLISTEFAPYPYSDTGQFIYPHRRLFAECVKVFKASGRVVPVFIDKHLADTSADSQWIYDTAKEMHIPLMAGSSIPVSMLASEATIEPGAEVKEIVGISYHTLTTYGFHGVEMVQALAERRKGGESGVKQVRCLTGDAVWEAAGKEYDPELLASALQSVGPRIPKGKTLQQAVKEPILFVIDYADGLRVNLFTLNGAVAGWSAAWRYGDGHTAATLAANEAQITRIRFDWQMKGVEDMVLTGKPSWPAERTLMTSGILDAACISKRDGGRLVRTPYLVFSYQPDLTWRPPEGLRTKGLEK